MLVLMGARRTLDQHKPLLFLSVHPAHLKALGQSTEEVAEFLRDAGYEMRDAAGSRVEGLGSGEYMCVAESSAGTIS